MRGWAWPGGAAGVSPGWTESFELLHAAALGGASAEEIQRLEAAELDELQDGQL